MATMLSQPSAPVLVEVEGALGFLTLNRPQRRNALSMELMQALHDDLRTLGDNTAIQVIVIRAKGSVFSAGHDLTELVDRDLETYSKIFDACVRMMEMIQTIPQPVIAAVQGPATAAGCQLVATCDLAVAIDSAWFATPGVRIGLFCSTPMVAVSRTIGRKKMMEMLLTGDSVSAAEALAIGLINKVVPADALDASVVNLAEKIAAMSPYVVGLGKQAFYRQIELSQHEAYEFTRDVMAANAESGAAREGIRAFLEKRPPRWNDQS